MSTIIYIPAVQYSHKNAITNTAAGAHLPEKKDK
jgi:hypothetical protein